MIYLIIDLPGSSKRRKETCATLCLLQTVANDPNRVEEVLATDTLETIDIDDDKLEEFTLHLKTDKFGTIKAVFDSGASINCIEAAYARKLYAKYIKR